MIAARTPIPHRGVPGVNVVLYSGGEIHINDIETADQGQEILDEIDAAIIQIEGQLASDRVERDDDWRRRAHIALKRKRRIRPALQQRIGTLRRTERHASPPAADRRAGFERRETRRKAFIDAAERMLDAELFTEIWARAEEMTPAAFGETEASHA